MIHRNLHSVATPIRKIKSIVGKYQVPCDESILQTALFVMSHSVGKCAISNFSPTENAIQSVRCLRELGVRIEKTSPTSMVIYGMGACSLKKPESILQVGNCTVSLSMLVGSLCSHSFNSVVVCQEQIFRSFYESAEKHLKKTGATFLSSSTPFIINGTSCIPDVHYLEHSCYGTKSALIMSGLNTVGRTTIIEPFSGSKDHAELMLQSLGAGVFIKQTKEEKKVIINGITDFAAQDIQIPGNTSLSAFLAAAAVFLPSSEIEIENVCLNYKRLSVYRILRRMGADITIKEENSQLGEKVGTISARSCQLNATTINKNEVAPEDMPIVFVLAANANGKTIIKGIGSDYLSNNPKIDCFINNLISIGADICVDKSQITINGKKLQGGKVVDAHNDHNIGLAFIICSFASLKPISLVNQKNHWFSLFYNS